MDKRLKNIRSTNYIILGVHLSFFVLYFLVSILHNPSDSPYLYMRPPLIVSLMVLVLGFSSPFVFLLTIYNVIKTIRFRKVLTIKTGIIFTGFFVVVLTISGFCSVILLKLIIPVGIEGNKNSTSVKIPSVLKPTKDSLIQTNLGRTVETIFVIKEKNTIQISPVKGSLLNYQFSYKDTVTNTPKFYLISSPRDKTPYFENAFTYDKHQNQFIVNEPRDTHGWSDLSLKTNASGLSYFSMSYGDGCGGTTQFFVPLDTEYWAYFEHSQCDPRFGYVDNYPEDVKQEIIQYEKEELEFRTFLDSLIYRK